MRVAVVLCALCLAVSSDVLQRNQTTARRGSGVKIGAGGGAGAGSGSASGPGSAAGSGSRSRMREGGLRVGLAKNREGAGRFAVTTPTPVTTSTSRTAGVTALPEEDNKTLLTAGMMVPYKMFGWREYPKTVNMTINSLKRASRSPALKFFEKYRLQVIISMMRVSPTPTCEYIFLYA